jgi:acyl-CoA thioesterase
LVLAQALAAGRQLLVEPRPCRALVATFPGPLAAGVVDVTVRTLRHGRAVSNLQVELTQDGTVGCAALLSFGGARPSAIDVPPPSPPTLAAPETLPPMLAGAGGVAPEFTRHFDYRLGFGAGPYAGADVCEIGGWCRFRAEPGPLGEEHVLGLLDAWPSPAVARMAAPAPAASITWSAELLSIEPEVDPRGWWLYRAELETARDGYAHASACLWSPAGNLAALSRQAVAVFG